MASLALHIPSPGLPFCLALNRTSVRSRARNDEFSMNFGAGRARRWLWSGRRPRGQGRAPVPMGIGVPMFFAAVMPHWRDPTLRGRLFTRVRRIGILGSWLTSCPSAHTFPSRRNKLQPLRATWTSRKRARPLPAPLLDPGQLPYQLPAALGRNASLVLRRGGKEF